MIFALPLLLAAALELRPERTRRFLLGGEPSTK